jgi:hypothetical protein
VSAMTWLAPTAAATASLMLGGLPWRIARRRLRRIIGVACKPRLQLKDALLEPLDDRRLTGDDEILGVDPTIPIPSSPKSTFSTGVNAYDETHGIDDGRRLNAANAKSQDSSALPTVRFERVLSFPRRRLMNSYPSQGDPVP